MHNDNKKSTAYLVLTGVLASQFVVNESVASAQGFLTNSEILLNKEGANSNETTNNLDYNAVEKVDLSKELEKDENTETEQKLTYEYIDESSIRAPKEELDSKELAKRLIIPIFSFASVGAATGIINHLVDSKNEQQNKKEDDPIPEPNQEDNTIPRLNQEDNTIPMQNQEDNTIPRLNKEDDPGNNFLKIIIYTVLTVILLWLFGKFVIAPLAVLRVRSEKGLSWLNLLTKLKVRPKKVEFIINEIDDDGNPPHFIIEAAEKKLIRPGDKVKTPDDKFGEFVIEKLDVLEVHDKKELSRLNLLTKLKVWPEKVKFIINGNEINEEGNPPDFIIEAAQKNLILNGDEVITPDDKFGKFVIKSRGVLEVRDKKGLFWLKLLTKLKLRPEKVKFIIDENEINDDGNPPDFIIDAAQKNLILNGDEVKTPNDKFGEFVIEKLDVLEVHGKKELFRLNLLTKLNLRPKKVKFIIDENEINDDGNLPAFIIEADKKNLISSVDEVIIPENKFGKFVSAHQDVLEVYGNGGLFWLKWLTEHNVWPKKVEFIINEIDNNGNPPDFIIDAAQKKLILNGDEVITPDDKFGKFVIESRDVLEVRDEKELSWLNLLTKLKVRPEKVKFIIDENEINDDGNLPAFIIEADKKNLISSVDEVIIPENKFGKFVSAHQDVLEVYGNRGLNLLTKLKVRPKKVKFIIDKIEKDGNPPDFIIEAARKKLISPGDEVIIKNEDLLAKCANNILDNCGDIIFFVDPKATADLNEYIFKYTGELKVFSVSELLKYYIDMAKESNTNSLDDFRNFVDKVAAFSFNNVFYGKKITYDITGARNLISVIVQPDKGSLINMSWTRLDNGYCEGALRFLEKYEEIDNDYIRIKIDATKLYRSILLEAGFVFAKNVNVLKPNGQSSPGGVEIFQMLLCMEKLLNGNNWEGIVLQAYKFLLIEFYYYSIINPLQSKDKKNIKNDEWNKKVFEKLKELKGKQEVSKDVLIEKIEELKGFLREINSEINADELKKKVYGSILQNNGKVYGPILQNQ